MTDLSAYSPAFIAANRDALIAQGVDPKDPAMPVTQEALDKVADAKESELQKLVEQWLYHRGYHKRTSTWILSDNKPEHGWQYHLHDARKNPILLDILLLGNDGRYLEIELKRQGGKYSSVEQEALCTVHGRPCFDSFLDVVQCVMDWDGGELVNPVRQVKQMEDER